MANFVSCVEGAKAMIRKEKHIEIRLRVLEQLDEMLRLLKTGDGFPRRSQSDNRSIPKQDSRARWEAEWRPQALSKCFLGAGTAKSSSLRSFLAPCGNAHVQRPNFRRAQGNCRDRGLGRADVSDE